MKADNVTLTYNEKGRTITPSIEHVGKPEELGQLSYVVKDEESGKVIEVNSTTGEITTKKVGTATVVVTASENTYYPKATKEITVTVEAKKIADCGFDVEKDSFVADGEEKTINISLTDQKVKLEEGKDYDLSGDISATYPGTYTTKVTGKGIYKGETSVSWRIGYSNIDVKSVKLNKNDLVLKKGEETTLEAVITPADATNKSVSFTPSDESVVKLTENGNMCTLKAVVEGTATVTVRTIDGNLTDVCSITVVDPDNKDILDDDGKVKEGLNIILSKSKEADGKYHYDGSAKQPAILVYDGAKKLIENIDYTLKYANNINAYILTEENGGFSANNAPSVTVSFKGDYSGGATKYFTIEPVSIKGSEFNVNEDSTISTISVALKGNSVTPKVNLYYNGKSLNAGKDYSYEIFEKSDSVFTKSLGNTVTTEGDYVVRFIEKNNYSETKIFDLKVRSNYKDISGLSFSKVENKVYSGEAITQNIVITDKTDKNSPYILELNKDYTVGYLDNTNAGTATVVINGLGDYCGTKKFNFKITGMSIGTTTIEGIPSSKNPVLYTGSPVELSSLVVKASDGTVLKKDSNYSVEYKNNTDVGKATVIITGKGAYTGTAKKTFTISPFDIGKDYEKADSDRKVEIDVNKTALYAKSGAKPAVLVKFKSSDGKIKVLDEKDIKITYKNNAAIANKDEVAANKVPTVTITGKGCFKGSVNIAFSIVEKGLLNTTLTLKDKVYTDKPNKYQTDIIVTDTDGKKLKDGKDYEKNPEYTYKFATVVKVNGENVERQAGDAVQNIDIIPQNTTINVTVKAKEGGNYKGVISGSYRITSKSILSAKLAMKSQQYYTGKEITPGPGDFVLTIKEGGRQVTLNPYNEATGEGDFIIAGYKNNIKSGKATIIIKGAGNYGGELNAIFTIKQKSK